MVRVREHGDMYGDEIDDFKRDRSKRNQCLL